MRLRMFSIRERKLAVRTLMRAAHNVRDGIQSGRATRVIPCRYAAVGVPVSIAPSVSIAHLRTLSLEGAIRPPARPLLLIVSSS